MSGIDQVKMKNDAGTSQFYCGYVDNIPQKGRMARCHPDCIF